MARNYAALPHEYWDEMSDLTDGEFGRLVRALLYYSMTGEETALAGNERFFWKRVVNRERGLQQHYEEVAAKRRRAGKKGAASRWGGEQAAPEGMTRDIQEIAKFLEGGETAVWERQEPAGGPMPSI